MFFKLARFSNIANASRPLSPFISIYQPQLTWLMSIGHRVTGVFHSTILYTIGTTCALASVTSFTTIPQLYTQAITEASDLVLPVSIGMKSALAIPFVYHCLAGVRHLVWDTGLALSLRGVYATGWAVNIGSIIGGIGLSVL